jgi:hypothetical protein
MTIEDAIAKLLSMKKNYGDNIQIFFDCPNCNQSFTPGILVAQAIHWKAEEKKK